MNIMQKNVFFRLITPIFLAFSLSLPAQISTWYLEEMPRLRKGTTYLVTPDTISESCKKYIEVLKETWTLTPIKCIKPDEIDQYAAPNSSFFMFTSVNRPISEKKDRRGFTISENPRYTFFFELWICKERFFSSKRIKVKEDDVIQIASVELFHNAYNPTEAQFFSRYKLDGEGHLKNWSPGIFKNYLQSIMYFIEKKEERPISKDIFQPKLLQKLKKDTLFIPDYVFKKMNGFTGDDSKSYETEDFMSEYPYPYKIVSMAELDHRILTDPNGIHYMLLMQSHTHKIISVVNSKTGTILSSMVTTSYVLKPKDFRTIRQDIESE
jgi:hypothetical protein